MRLDPRQIAGHSIGQLVGVFILALGVSKGAESMMWHHFSQNDADSICKKTKQCASIEVSKKRESTEAEGKPRAVWTVRTSANTTKEDRLSIKKQLEAESASANGFFSKYLFLIDAPVVRVE